MLNFLMNVGANMLIKKKNPPQNQGGYNQNQGGYNQGGYNQGGYNQGGWNQNQGGWGGNQGGWQGQNQGSWGNQQNFGNNAEGQQWIENQKRMNQYNIVKPNEQNVDFNNLIAQQVVFIQPSPAKQRLEQLKRTGQPFIDDRFPTNEYSLSGEYGPQQDWVGIKWKPVTQMMKNPVLFHGKPMPTDIKQGYLGDCYFLAGLAALAERPDRIFNLFLLQQLNQQKYFSVKMLYKGKWMTIDMDEYIPWYNDKPAFSRSNQDELWVILLEKAWAKLYTSYKRIQAGYPQQAIHDLTGAPIRQIAIKNASFNKEQQWNYLMQASQKQYAMIASSQPGSDRNKSVSGVVQGHAYTVMSAIVLNANGQQERLLKLRNPWGKGQFTGRWSDGDQNWQYVNQQQRQRIGFNPDKNDGIFFIPYDEFVAEFRAITVAEIDDNASYVYRSVKDKECKGAYFTIEIIKQDLYCFQVDKTPQRIYPDKYQQMFQYPETLIELGMLQGNACQKLQGLKSSRRTLVKKQRLAPGKYVAFVKISYNPDFEDQYDVNLALYSPTVASIRLATHQQAAIFTGNPNVQWVGQPEQQQPMNQGNQQGNWGQQQQGGQQQNWSGNQQQQGWGGQQQQEWGGQQQQGWGGQQGGQQGWSGQQGGQQGWSGQQGGQQGWGGQQQGWSGQQGGQQGWSSQGDNKKWGW